MRREFALQDDTSDKFWTIERIGTSCVTTHGRMGAKPREARKELASEAEAQRELDRQVAAKLAKGYVEVDLGRVTKRGKTDWSALEMSEDVFWRIIGLFDWKKTGDDDAVVERAVAALAEMSEADIRRFEDLLAEKLYALDTEGHARGAGLDLGSLSVDLFLYVRCVVIANGRELYEHVLANPDEMPEDLDFEPILSVAGAAYERKTGRELDHITPVSYETFRNSAGWRQAGD
jgi:predicted DNA-binding WGR domain protein